VGNLQHPSVLGGRAAFSVKYREDVTLMCICSYGQKDKARLTVVTGNLKDGMGISYAGKTT
jgi:hypothetical protein